MMVVKWALLCMLKMVNGLNKGVGKGLVMTCVVYVVLPYSVVHAYGGGE